MGWLADVLLASRAHDGSMATLEPSRIAWGDYGRAGPHAAFAAARAEGPVQEVVLPDGHPAWVILGFEEAKAALNDPRLSKDMHAALAAGPDIVDEGVPGPAFARHMLAVDPPDHTRLRHLVADRFTPRAVTALEPRVREVIADLVDELAAAGPAAAVDLMEGFAFPMPFTVVCELLGVPSADRPALADSLDLILRPLGDPKALAAARAASVVLADTFGAVIAGKDAEPGDDLISDLVAARRRGELDDVELQSTAFNLIVAGHETTTNLIGNMMLWLLRDPERWRALQAQRDRIPATLEELMRHDGPVHHATFRFAAEPVALGEVTIPAGAQVLVCLAGANRDGSRYDEPDRFEIGRGGRSLAFGHGIHHCLGAALARMEGRLALDALLDRFPAMALAADPDDLRWDRGDGLVVRGLVELPVTLGPASP